MSNYLNSLMEYTAITGSNRVRKNDVAIIGMWGEFGPTKNPAQFWEALCQGKDLGRELPEIRAEDMENYLNAIGKMRQNIYYKHASYMEDIDQFDYSFFGISPKEASLIDPSQRIFLQTVWHAIEDSGYSTKSLMGKDVGIYIGYTDDMLYKQRVESVDPDSISIAIPGNVRSMMGGRIAYLLNLHGPSMVIDTACSSSLVAVHTACRAIQDGDCELAIVGSTKLFLNPLQKDTQFLYGVMSEDDRTRSYDASADGFGIGEGTGAIILKALDKAIIDKDNIYAVIKGSAITQDGASIGITAPNLEAQEEVLRRAWQAAGIAPEDIDYIEGHGTATTLGDAVELQALGNMFRKSETTRKCFLGSVKSNIGHLDHAAGMAGLIKLLLMIKNKKIPPTVYFEKPNSLINTSNIPIQINSELLEWQSNNKVRTCCISSFGISGTNCHMVLQEYNSQPNDRKKENGNLFTLSAKTKVALRKLVQSYIAFLRNSYDLAIDDICYTANVGREQYQYRFATSCIDIEDLIVQLEDALGSGYFDELNPSKIPVDKRVQVECDDLIFNWKSGGRQDKELLNKIEKLYCAGADILWHMFYEENLQRVSLPVYPFSETKCWYETVRLTLCHELIWERQNFLRHMKNTHVAEHVVIIGPRCEFVDQLTQVMEEQTKIFTLAEYGEEDKAFLNEQVLQGFIESVDWKHVTHIVYCLSSVIGSTDSDKDLKKRLDKGVYAAFRVIKKVLEYSRNKCQLIIIGNNTYNVYTDETELHPENAVSYGIGKVVNLEYPHIQCRCIDISSDTEIKDVYHEIFEDDSHTFLVALRGHQRFVQKMCCMEENKRTTRAIKIKKDGVYVITGGTGAIGLKICQFLSECQEVQLVLINREPLPSREHWINESRNYPEKIRSCIEIIQKIEKMHTKVSLYNADVSNEAEITGVIEDIMQKFGKIDGIVHCAGIPGDGVIVNKEEHIFREVLAPKVEGTWLLHLLTKQFCPDFFILFSSVTAITGAFGQSDYCAANSFLNAFSEYRNSLGLPTLSITWTKWKGVGIGVDFEIDLNKEMFYPINHESALKVFKRIWNSSAANIIVGEVNHFFSPDIDRNIRTEQIVDNLVEKSNSSLSNRLNIDATIVLNGKNYECEYTYYEKLIATIWKEVLGYDTFCIHDSFFDIGGDSLKIRGVYAHIEEMFPGKVTIVDLFTYSTIFQLSRFINDSYKDDAKKMNNLSKELRNLISDLRQGKHSLEEIVERYDHLA